ncbi:MAG: hypothetical protein AB8H80_08900 [Planctomycetota bacterium]
MTLRNATLSHATLSHARIATSSSAQPRPATQATAPRLSLGSLSAPSLSARPLPVLALLALALLLPPTAGCSINPDLPQEPPALVDMEEPLDLRIEPNDESKRVALAKGTFSGLYLRDSRDTLAAKLDEPDSVEVERVVENSPAALAGIAPGDLVLEAEVDGDARTIRRPSEWRRIELEAQPGTEITLFLDRAGREARTTLRLVERASPPPRALTARFREEQRAGIVVRTATEVEARGAGLGPGGGAVLIGMSQKSPWRRAGLRFKDLLVAVDDAEIAHPEDLLQAIRDKARASMRLTYTRGGRRFTTDVALTDRDQETNEITIPLLFSYEADRGKSEWSLLLGMFNYRSTKAAWRFRLLWLIGFGGGDSDQLLESGS